MGAYRLRSRHDGARRAAGKLCVLSCEARSTLRCADPTQPRGVGPERFTMH